MNSVNNENIQPDKYGKLEDDSSISIPVENNKIGSILNNISSENFGTNRAIFTEGSGRKFVEDKKFMDEIESWYARALDSVGLNFNDPIQAYGTHFNKNMQTLGLDPQRPGNSYVFFTRPDLNFSSNSKSMTPFFEYIMKSEIGNFVAEYLQFPDNHDSAVILDDKYKTKSPFDPLKSNLCKEVSGVKDIVLDSYETVGDFMGHQLSYATGADGHDSIGEVTVTFEDTTLSPIFLNHYLHIQYIHEVARGEYWPRYKYIAERMIDYTISIYIFKLAEDNQTILRWGKLTGCYPISIPLNSLNHSRELKMDEFDEISVTYKYNFYEPMDPRVFQDFNKLVLPLAIQGGKKSMFDEGKELGTLRLIEPHFPEQLLLNSENDRIRSMWSQCPLVIGGKLLFV